MSPRAATFSAVVFDLDGTLIHSAPDMHVAVNRMLERLGRAPLSLEQVVSFVGEGVFKLVERSLRATGDVGEAPPPLLDQGVALFRAFYGEAPAELTQPYDGVGALMERLTEQTIPLGVCTNKPEEPTRAILDALALSAPFGAVVGGDRLTVRKPDPAPLRLCFEELRADPAQGLYVGDSETDEATAAALGAPFALYTGGYRKKPPGDFKTVFAFDRYDALLRWLQEPV